MSNLTRADARCPRCGHVEQVTVFDSLNADNVPEQAALVLDGTFELRSCAGCGHPYRPEHRMLYAHLAERAWIVMYPPAERAGFAGIENIVAQQIEELFAAAPPMVNSRVHGVRPRLVFGQHMLTEAVRAARDGVDAALLECAKLLAVRRDLGRLMRVGPFELCFEHITATGELLHGVHVLPGGARIETVELPRDLLAETRAGQAAFEERFPDLFRRPYVSACRYLYGAAV